MLQGASRIVNICAAVQAGEKVVIVTDFLRLDIAEMLAAAVMQREAEVVVSVMAPRQVDGAEPPKAVVKSMEAADVLLTPVTRSLGHSDTLRTCIDKGARAISLSAFIPQQLISGGIEADFVELEPRCTAVAQLLTAAKQARLITPAGTDITFDLRERVGVAHPGLARRPGEITSVPNIEASISPAEGSATGVFVADASVPYFEIGLLREPVHYEVKEGRVVEIKGGDQARLIADIMANSGSDATYNIAQLAFGLNPYCRMSGLMLEDEGVDGTAHIGIGTSRLFGGTVKAPLHYDALMWSPTLEVDGEVVLRNGEWLTL
jgi:2,5-dihydroxypyridine 5,6-dioxygenase